MTALILLVVFWLVLAIVHARLWPRRVCPRCRGVGEVGPGPHALRTCPRCGGSKRVRRLLAPRD